jgi:hypothetical protein
VSREEGAEGRYVSGRTYANVCGQSGPASLVVLLVMRDLMQDELHMHGCSVQKPPACAQDM